MLFRRPCYYDKFTCTAEKCTDNCCIGWEICIDGETADFYKAVDGDFGKRLKENITAGDEPSFILKSERCPFLNKNNLCDIIINLGENALCQICRDHPRWFEWYGNEKEGGVGLSCEEGARLILTEESFADYFESEVNEEPDEDFDKDAYKFLLSVREDVFNILCENNLSFTDKANRILDLCIKAEAELNGGEKILTPPFNFDSELAKALPVLEKTEPIDEKWTKEFEKLKVTALTLNPDKNEEKYLTRLFAYFVWRYFLTAVFDYRVTEKIRLALFSVAVIYALYSIKADKSIDSLLISTVLYSKQMEYSTENLNIFFLHS